MLNSAEHERFSAHKYETDNNSLYFHIYKQSNFNAQLARKNLPLLVIWHLLAGLISDQLSWKWKKKFYNLGAWLLPLTLVLPLL